jgi:hypothetical protein
MSLDEAATLTSCSNTSMMQSRAGEHLKMLSLRRKAQESAMIRVFFACVCAVAVSAQNVCSLFFVDDEDNGDLTGSAATGIIGADAICQANFMGSNYRRIQLAAGILYDAARAWVSTSGNNVMSRLGGVPDVCVENLNRQRVANSFTAFRTMPLLRAPNIKTDGSFYTRDKVYTATTAAGVHVRGSDDSCNDFLSSSGTRSAVIGHANDTTKWSNDGLATDSCDKPLGIYCFVPVIVPTSTPTPKLSPTPKFTPTPTAPTPKQTPAPTPTLEAGSPCTSYTNCAQCVNAALTRRNCRFCGSACLENGEFCAAMPNVATDGVCPSSARTPVPSVASTSSSSVSAATTTSPSDTVSAPLTTSASASATDTATTVGGAGVGMEPSGGGLDTGAIIGIAVGGVCCGLISALVLVAIVRACGKSNASSDQKSSIADAVVPRSEYGSFPSDSREALPTLKSKYASAHSVEYQSARAFEDDDYAAGRVKP